MGSFYWLSAAGMAPAERAASSLTSHRSATSSMALRTMPGYRPDRTEYVHQGCLKGRGTRAPSALSVRSMVAGAPTTGNNVRVRNLLSFLAGSVSSISQYYWMQDPKKLDAFDDYLKYPGNHRDGGGAAEEQ